MKGRTFGDLLSSEHKDHFFLMHLSDNGKDRERLWKHAKDNSVIGLDSVTEVPRPYWEMSDSEKQSLRLRHPILFNEFEMFCNEMPYEKDALVVVMNGWDSILGIGRIKLSRCDYKKEWSEREGSEKPIFFDHVMSIKWEPKYTHSYNQRQVLETPLKGFNRILLKVKRNTKFWIALSDVELSD